MRCPYCQFEDTRVIDSREGDGGESVRRRRECQSCSERYTTYERVELRLPFVVKTDGTREKFDERKLRNGFERALQKRPIEAEAIEAAVQRLMRRFSFGGEQEVETGLVGEAVMNELREMDDVAYVRFASVYRQFQDLDEFNEVVQRLKDVLPPDVQKAQLPLFKGEEDETS